jgi:hypothetical protein
MKILIALLLNIFVHFSQSASDIDRKAEWHEAYWENTRENLGGSPLRSPLAAEGPNPISAIDSSFPYLTDKLNPLSEHTAYNKYYDSSIDSRIDFNNLVDKDARNLSILMITVGSRGDVQYWIPICLRLMKHGHRCTLGTHERFKDWIVSFGIAFFPIAGDPENLMVIFIFDITLCSN